MHEAHQANAIAKAERAADAIDQLIVSRLIDDPDFADITDLQSGRVAMIWELFGPDMNPAMWVAVGVMYDMLHDTHPGGYQKGDQITGFDSSRHFIDRELRRRAKQTSRRVPATDDPFTGLNGGPRS
jgi:hypothetical protein